MTGTPVHGAPDSPVDDSGVCRGLTVPAPSGAIGTIGTHSMKGRHTMSYTVLHQANGMIPTVKDEETISVQVAQVVNRAGAVSNRIEARVYVNNPVSGYEGPTKTALVFDHVDDVDDFISALTEARQFFTTLAAAPKTVGRQA